MEQFSKRRYTDIGHYPGRYFAGENYPQNDRIQNLKKYLNYRQKRSYIVQTTQKLII